MKLLIAGIGNIFQGDDAFGCEVIRQLDPGAFPESVTLKDYGISSYDLAYALTSDYDAVILVDAVSRGQPPGTLFLIEPEVNPSCEFERTAVDAHSMNPVAVIQMAQSLCGVKGRLFLIGCESAILENDEGELGLSAEVQNAVLHALAMINSLAHDLLNSKEKTIASLETA